MFTLAQDHPDPEQSNNYHAFPGRPGRPRTAGPPPQDPPQDAQDAQDFSLVCLWTFLCLPFINQRDHLPPEPNETCANGVYHRRLNDYRNNSGLGFVRVCSVLLGFAWVR